MELLKSEFYKYLYILHKTAVPLNRKRDNTTDKDKVTTKIVKTEKKKKCVRVCVCVSCGVNVI